MQFVGAGLIVMMGALWSNHTHKTHFSHERPPEACQMFDTRYSPRYKASCDAWDAAHKGA